MLKSRATPRALPSSRLSDTEDRVGRLYDSFLCDSRPPPTLLSTAACGPHVFDASETVVRGGAASLIQDIEALILKAHQICLNA